MMQTKKNNIFSTLVMALFLSFSISAQDNESFEMSYEINRVYPAFSNTKANLKKAVKLIDLNRHYEEDWVREYVAVDIITTQNGSVKVSNSKSDVLNQEQKDQMLNADVGTEIIINVKYVPENNLSFNETKEINFSFITEPENSAKFIGGLDQQNDYLARTVIEKLPENSFGRYNLATIKFTINESGQIVNPHLFWSSNKEDVDKILLEAICNMPTWRPAEYADGTRIKQDFALTVGDKESCALHMLNLK